jgi:hypothetical protein
MVWGRLLIVLDIWTSTNGDKVVVIVVVDDIPTCKCLNILKQ